MATILICHNVLFALETTIEKAIAIGIDHSYSVRSQAEESTAAYFEYRAAQAALWPTISFNASATYLDPLQKIEQPFMDIKLGRHENYLIEMGLYQILFGGGRLLYQSKMQRALYETGSLEFQALKQKNALRIRSLSLQYLAAIASLKATEASLQRVKLIIADIHKKYETGMADSFDLLDCELSLCAAQREIIEKAANAKAAAVALTSALGLAADEKIVFLDSIPTPANPSLKYDDVSPEKIDRPELDALAGKIKASKYLQKSLRASLLPSISAFATYAYGRPNRILAGDSWNDSYTAGLKMSWDFNLGNKALKNVKAAAARSNAYSLSREQAAEEFIVSAKAALIELQESYDQYLLSHKEYEIAAKKYRLAVEKQRAGTLSTNQLLESEKELALSEQKHNLALLNYYLKQTGYFYAVGSPKIYGGLD